MNRNASDKIDIIKDYSDDKIVVNKKNEVE